MIFVVSYADPLVHHRPGATLIAVRKRPRECLATHYECEGARAMTDKPDLPMTVSEALVFADKKQDGAFPVTAADGSVVARIAVRWTGSSFEATTAEGTPLCSGKHHSAFSRHWEAYSPGGTQLALVRSSLWGRGKTVTLADGRELRVGGSAFSRGWTVTDAAGRTVLDADAQGSSFSFHPDGFAVRCYDDSLGLAQIVAIVELNRLIVKAGRNAAAGGGAAAAAGSA